MELVVQNAALRVFHQGSWQTGLVLLLRHEKSGMNEPAHHSSCLTPALPHGDGSTEFAPPLINQ
jgi:hypothetical protein